MSAGRPMAEELAPEAPWPLEVFLAHALAIEEEAVLRYVELAEQMEAHHNAATAQLFRDLAADEEKHAARMRQLIGRRTVPVPAPWEYRWPGTESPEAPPYDAAHYLMAPSHALELALAAERRAEGFFAAVAAHAADPETKLLAQEFAVEEKLHAARIGAVLERMPAPPSDWRADYDPPLGLG